MESVLDFLLNNIEFIFMGFTAIFGTLWFRIKNVLKAVVEAAADDKITPEEVQNIILAWKKK